VEKARTAIRGDADDAFFSGLRQQEVAAMTGTAAGVRTLQQSREFARDFFASAVLEFTDEEARAVTAAVSQLQVKFGANYPLLVRRPWRFIKTRDDLCGGFSFTRGDCIVFSQRTVNRFVHATDDPKEIGPLMLLLHEQLHVLQRCEPQLFRPLYEQVFGFHHARVVIHEWIDARQVTNPDGTDEDWYVRVQGKDDACAEPYWIGTILVGEKPIPTMGRDFSGVAVQLRLVEDHYEMLVDDDDVPVYRQLSEFPELYAQFPIRHGYDHPNEIAAYLCPGILLNDGADEEHAGRAAEILHASRIWFEEHLKENHENKGPTQ
jgi:hypothetical protein